MASVTARLSMMGDDGYGEQEKDANSQLVELDKGLRSQKAGEQCEAIVRFPRLFEKYPFPILINSAFLKLADVFRVGNNLLRLCVLKVAQQSCKHLDKVLSVDEFISRIYMVIHSNDPVARAITLRTLGSCAPVISERKNVHHSILNGLESHDSVELEAAIYAASCFAAESKSFATSICGKLAEMIEGLATPVEIKLKLIPIFQHMHHDGSTADRVRTLCCQLLPSYPARGFVLVILHTLSQLAAKSLMDIPLQIDLLLKYLGKDPRKSVKILALQDMALLARKAPHMWKTNHVQALCTFMMTTVYEGLKIGALSVLTTLSDSIAVSQFDTTAGSPVLGMCKVYVYHSNMKIAAMTAQVLTNIAIHKYKVKASDKEQLCEESSTALEALIIISTSEQSQHNLQALKTCLHSIVQLCLACPTITDRLVDIMMSTLNSVSGEYSVLLCECLAAASSHHNDLLRSLVSDILEALLQASNSKDSHREKLMVCLFTLLFQACIDDNLQDEDASRVHNLLDSMNCWNIYKVGRQAARYGHHQIASCIFNSLCTKVSTEQFYFWLSALKDCSLAETCLQSSIANIPQFMSKVAQAETHYNKAIVALKAAMTPSYALEFQYQYMKLRTQMLQTQTQLIKGCCSFQTSPPPAIATSLAMTTGKEVHKCSHIVAQLRKCSKLFEELCQKYGNLYQASFDADPATLTSVQILQQCCQVMVHVLDTILSQHGSRSGIEVNVNTSILPAEQSVLIEHQPWVASSRQILELLQQTIQQPDDTPLTYQHMECIERAAMTIIQVPLCLPRFFFQSCQATSIKLAISPQPRSHNEPVNIHYDTHLTLKVEGVIQHGSQPGLFRKMHSIDISVCSSQQSRTQMVSETKVTENPSNDMTQTAEPHNDYFSAQFLLAFPVTGIHIITVETAVVDEDGGVWKTGPKTTLTVKSYDEAVQRQQQQQYATQRHQQRTAISGGSQQF